MKKLFFLALFLIPLFLFSQEEKPKSNVLSVGSGFAFLGSGDRFIGKLAFDYNKRLSNYFELELSLNFGHLNKIESKQISNLHVVENDIIITTYHLDNNIYVNPFKFNKGFNFSLGTGYSLMYVTELYGSRLVKGDPRSVFNINQKSYESRTSIGYNIIPRFSYQFKNNSVLTFKLMMQSYLNGDISSGAMLSFGKVF